MPKHPNCYNLSSSKLVFLCMLFIMRFEFYFGLTVISGTFFSVMPDCMFINKINILYLPFLILVGQIF